MKDTEVKKRELEESLDALNEECAKLKAQGQDNPPTFDFTCRVLYTLTLGVSF